MTETAIVPVENLAALEAMDPATREVAVTRYLTDARDRLASALEATGPEAVAALKAEIATAAEATKQLGLSKEIQTDAQEMVRRAEFALGKAIRAGQERGEIKTIGDGGPRSDYERNGATVHVTAPAVQHLEKKSSRDFFPEGNGTMSEIYALTDGVSAPVFDAALSDAKAEGNLSRANVLRKIKDVKQEGLTPVERLRKLRELAPSGMTSGQIGKEIGVGEEYVRRLARANGIEIPADRIMSRSRRGIDHTRIVRETVAALEGLASGLQLLNPSEVDQADATYWATSLTDSLRALNRLNRQIKEMTQ